MELVKAINERKSIRGYLDKPVEKETIEAVLRLAQRSVSALNTQPWQFAVVTGDVLKKLAEKNLEDYRAGRELDYADPPFDGEYRRRRIGIAKQLFAAMDIAREDRKKRDWWSERGFGFFGAPAVILIYMAEEIDENACRFEMGTVAQSITLAALEFGLGTCVENQAIMYQSGIKEYLDLPEGSHLAAGIAIGYPDPDFAANKVVSERVPLEDVTSWYGF